MEQGNYGHRARKATWLYAHGTELPSLKWGPSARRVRLDFGFHSAEERRKFARPPAGLSDDERARRREWLEWYERETGKAWCAPERMGRYERLATPIPVPRPADLDRQIGRREKTSTAA